MRQTSAAFILAQASLSELLASIARQASSITKVANPSARASSAEWATQKSVARPQAKTRFDPARFEERAETGRRLAVGLDEGGIGVNADVHALAQNEKGAIDREVRREAPRPAFPARSARAIGSGRRSARRIVSKGLAPAMARGERGMPGRMPVLGDHDIARIGSPSRLTSGTISSPLSTASAPPGMKSTCRSIARRTSSLLIGSPRASGLRSSRAGEFANVCAHSSRTTTSARRSAAG